MNSILFYISQFKRLICSGFTVFVFLPLSAIGFESCSFYDDFNTGSNANTSLSIVSWNVQSLFDGRDDGWEYEEFRDGSGWSEEKYTARLNSIAKAIMTMGEKTPDVIAFIELENSEILEKLYKDFLYKQGYKYSFFAGNPGYSLGIGVLSKLKLTKTAAHSMNVDGEIIPRPVAELWLDADGVTLILFACHWKSKLGGEKSTEKLRREAAKIIIRRQREFAVSDPNTPIIILGDLNENHDEFYRSGLEYICALLPDDPDAARLAGFSFPSTDGDEISTRNPFSGTIAQDFLILSGEKPPESVFFNSSDGIFYSPWGNEITNGSYFYKDNWETIDHFLLNAAFFDNADIEFKNCYVMDCEPFVNSKGEPDRYNPRTGLGLSDHLPLLLTLTHRP
ncbi:MAG: endonuclease/exonuclease/phosphatase family protein [Spirochaetaceae bacterium]|jgi:endonuclease/exonuclease/phosphatase family metal-dependent hydrolase|nr:endonuclease/exonuclease/phosphatase family protein [Spirochaetaceae bacterium]